MKHADARDTSQPDAPALSGAWAVLLGDWNDEGGGAPGTRADGAFRTYVTGVNARTSPR